MKAYRLFLIILLVLAFAATGMAASVTINHGGGSLSGTLTSLSVDANGNVTLNVSENLGSSGGSGGGGTSDTEAPGVPSNLNAAAASSSQINLSWSASTDNVGVAGYKIYRDGTQITTTSATSYANTGLSASTGYCYKVSAYDSAGNNSGQSSQTCATTSQASSGGDTGGGSTSGGTYIVSTDGRNGYTDYVVKGSPKKYYFTTDKSYYNLNIAIASTDWVGNADMIISTTSYPSCDDFGKSGTYSNQQDTSGESVSIRGISAGTTFYITVCGAPSGGYRIWWSGY